MSESLESIVNTAFDIESSVSVYWRKFPAVFTKAKGHLVWDQYGQKYIDFFVGSGVLNYGHNHPQLKERLLEYLTNDGIVHSLDLHTTAKRDFIATFREVVLDPRGLNYRLQFPGPTGTNAVEAAFKIARKVTGRQPIVAFTNGFHGMTLGALSATANRHKRGGAGVSLSDVIRMPYDGYLGEGFDTVDYLERLIIEAGSGVDMPAAIIVETVQAEGGLYTAHVDWLQRLQQCAQRHGILLIVDDIQAGCGRTGTFFSFEHAGLVPDIVCLSKALSGYGLPLALVLLKPEWDQQKPGEHSGTFRGNNLGFVTGQAALSFWEQPSFQANLQELENVMEDKLLRIVSHGSANKRSMYIRGKGLLRGIVWADQKIASQVSRSAFDNGLLVDTSGANNDVLKLLPPLTIEVDQLAAGLDVLDHAIKSVVV